ncbi:MAG TPA: CAP domain-containing protein [Sandaracinaceae bacterium LLY-WYZ-13_1]|nr:CAP domain-containing protein [Sandaracinaceae bacterium LLY-WYZ-13_1]
MMRLPAARAWSLAALLLPACDGAPLDDPDGSAPSCEPAPAACTVGASSDLPADLSASSGSATDDFGGSACGRGGDGVPDVAFRYTAPVAGTYRFDTEGSGFDTVLSIRAGCGGEELACNDDIRRGAVTASRLTVDLAACETVVVVVDGFGEGDVGAVSLHVEAEEGRCDDGLDDDGDGRIDCDDPDCFSVECSGGDDWPEAWQALEWEVLEIVNRRRAEGAVCGGEELGPAPPLEMDAVIREAARKHSVDMGEQDYFEHESLDGRTFADRMREEGFMGASPWGENIAAGSPTAERVMEGWMDSPGHCRNIMNPAYRVIGIGYAEAEGSTFGRYWTQNFAASH